MRVLIANLAQVFALGAAVRKDRNTNCRMFNIFLHSSAYPMQTRSGCALSRPLGLVYLIKNV